MIKFENGTKEVFSSVDKEKVVEGKVNTKTQSSDKPSYKEKVSTVQGLDPSLNLFFGGGKVVLGGMFFVGSEYRIPSKNIFVRWVTLGFRVGWADGSNNTSGVIRDWDCSPYYNLHMKYYAPLPIRMVQPYASLGLGYFPYYHSTYYVDSKNYVIAQASVDDSRISPNFVMGANFMFLKHFGMFL